MKQNNFVFDILVVVHIRLSVCLALYAKVVYVKVVFSINSSASPGLVAHNGSDPADPTKQRTLSSICSGLTLQSVSMVCLLLAIIFYT